MASKYSEFRKNKIIKIATNNKVKIEEIDQLTKKLKVFKIDKTEKRTYLGNQHQRTKSNLNVKKESLLVKEYELNQTCDQTTNIGSQIYYRNKDLPKNNSITKRCRTQYEDIGDPFISFGSARTKTISGQEECEKNAILEGLRKIEEKIKKKNISDNGMGHLTKTLVDLHYIVDNL